MILQEQKQDLPALVASPETGASTLVASSETSTSTNEEPAGSTPMRQGCPRSADSSSGSVQIFSPGGAEFYDAVAAVDDLLTNHFEPPAEIEIDDFDCPQSKYAIQPPADNNEERMVTLNFLVGCKRCMSNPEIGDVKRGEEMLLGGEIWRDKRENIYNPDQVYIVLKNHLHIVRQFRNLPFLIAERGIQAVPGEPFKVTIDCYDESMYAEEGMSVTGVRPIRMTFDFEHKTNVGPGYTMHGFFHAIYGTMGPSFIAEWENKTSRFHRPTTNPLIKNNLNVMDQDQVNGVDMEDGERPLDSDVEEEEYGELQFESQLETPFRF